MTIDPLTLKWEYRVVRGRYPSDNELAELGMSGWELVSAFRENLVDPFFVFKKVASAAWVGSTKSGNVR